VTKRDQKGVTAVVTDISKNLIRLRSARDLTQEAVANAAQISLAGYRKIESGESEPRAATVLALAKALDVKTGDVLRPAPALPRARFRSTKRMRERDLLLMDVADELGSYVELETLLDESHPFHPVEFATAVADTERRPMVIAAKVREAFGLQPDEAIRDICGLLEDRGIKVLRMSVASDAFFGLSVADSDLGPAIVVNTWERISVERWIFTAAHELGHLVLHHATDFDAAEVEEQPDHEKQADLFAAHFLMPDEAFQRAWDQASGLGLYERVLKVKRIFRVSYKTVLYRLHQQGRPEVWARFKAEAKRRTGKVLLKVDEPNALGPGDFLGEAVEGRKGQEPTQLTEFDFVTDRRQRLVRKAFESEQISIGRAAEILGVPLREMRQIAGSWF
jgi:Zn-dependent peptidase ImmA (M78 family)/DNA-binding XRE family transcriptional regulator